MYSKLENNINLEPNQKQCTLNHNHILHNIFQSFNYPLPSNRTLKRRFKNLKFDVGYLDEIFELIKLKVNLMDDEEKKCTLALHKVCIGDNWEYDSSNNKFLGNVALHSLRNFLEQHFFAIQ